MNTTNTYLRYFNPEDKSDEQFVSIADIQQSGIPIDENSGDEWEDDGNLYFYNKGNEEYKKSLD